MHDAGQPMFTAFAGVEKGSWHDAGRCGPEAVATLRQKIVTVLHDCLPFRPVWPRALALAAGLPVNDQVGHFVRDGVAQKVIEVLCQQLLVDAQAGFATVIDHGLPSASATQGKVDRGLGQVQPIEIAGALLCLTHGCFDLLLELFRLLLIAGHVSRSGWGCCRVCPFGMIQTVALSRKKVISSGVVDKETVRWRSTSLVRPCRLHRRSLFSVMLVTRLILHNGPKKLATCDDRGKAWKTSSRLQTNDSIARFFYGDISARNPLVLFFDERCIRSPGNFREVVWIIP